MGASERLKQAAGRLIVGKVPGKTLDDESRRLLEDGTMGGVTFFKDNAENLTQLSDLVYDIVEAYATGTEAMPFITVDQEGGAVQRFDHVITPLPSAMALAACQNANTVRDITSINAQELKLLGFNCLLAPVLDIAINEKNPIVSTRAFSNNISTAQSLGKEVIETLKSQAILAAGKHFPGHGGTTDDTHLALAVNDKSLATLTETELQPFKENISRLPAMLTSHVWFSSIDENPLPASLSFNITSKLLRESLKFDRLVITDDLLMKAITNKWGLGEAAVMALEAGADILLTCGSTAEIASVHQAIVNAVESGRLKEERLEQSLTRLERALLPLSKERYYSIRAGKRPDAITKIESSLTKNRKIAFEASLSAITQLRGTLPDLASEKWIVVSPDHPRYLLDLASFVNRSGLNIGQIRYSLNPTLTECQSIQTQVKGHNCIFLTFRTAIYQEQVLLGNMLKSECKNTLAVATDAPFDANHLPDWENYLATFDPSDLAMEALASILCLKRKPTGHSPVGLSATSIK